MGTSTCLILKKSEKLQEQKIFGDFLLNFQIKILFYPSELQ